MARSIQHNEYTWIDIPQASENDLVSLKEKFKLHPKIAQEFLPYLKRPKVEEHKNQIWMVLHFPVFNPEERKTDSAELDFIIIGKTLITAHRKNIEPLNIFFNDCEFQEKIREESFKSIGHLTFALIDFLIDAGLPMIDHIHEHIDRIEEQVFLGHEKEMLAEIAVVKRDIIDFRRIIKPQRGILEILTSKSSRFFNENLKQLTEEVIGSNITVWNNLENHKEMIEAIEKTNESSLSHKTNEIIKILTIISFITFPLSVIAGIFGMNLFEGFDFPGNPRSLLIIILIMIIFAGIMVIYFKIKKWF